MVYEWYIWSVADHEEDKDLWPPFHNGGIN